MKRVDHAAEALKNGQGGRVSGEIQLAQEETVLGGFPLVALVSGKKPHDGIKVIVSRGIQVADAQDGSNMIGAKEVTQAAKLR